MGAFAATGLGVLTESKIDCHPGRAKREPGPICGRPPACKFRYRVLIGSLAIICPACLRGRTWPLAKMGSATRVPNTEAELISTGSHGLSRVLAPGFNPGSIAPS